MKPPNSSCLSNYGITPNNYLLSIARLEPENNLEMMFDAYIASGVKTPYFVVGKHITSYGDFLKDKYRDKGIIFLESSSSKKEDKQFSLKHKNKDWSFRNWSKLTEKLYRNYLVIQSIHSESKKIPFQSVSEDIWDKKYRLKSKKGDFIDPYFNENSKKY